MRARRGPPPAEIDGDALALPVSIADGAHGLVMGRGIVDRVGLRHRRAFRQMRSQLSPIAFTNVVTS